MKIKSSVVKRRAKCDKIHLVPMPELHKVHIWFLVESWIYNTIECLFFYFWSGGWWYCLFGFGSMKQVLIFKILCRGFGHGPDNKWFDILCIYGVLNIVLLTTAGKQEKCMTNPDFAFNLIVEKRKTYKCYYKTINDKMAVIYCFVLAFEFLSLIGVKSKEISGDHLGKEPFPHKYPCRLSYLVTGKEAEVAWV